MKNTGKRKENYRSLYEVQNQNKEKKDNVKKRGYMANLVRV